MTKQDDAQGQPGEVRSSDVLGLVPEHANKAGATPCLVRWFVETPAGWLGAHDKEAFEAYRAAVEAAERERCAAVLRYWLAGYAPDTVASHEARCLAHILDGRPAPEGPNV